MDDAGVARDALQHLVLADFTLRALNTDTATVCEAISKRCAVLLDSLGRLSPDVFPLEVPNLQPMEKFYLRQLYVGGNFSATEAFVAKLPRDNKLEWTIGKMEVHEQSVQYVNVMDTTPRGLYNGMVVGSDTLGIHVSSTDLGASAVQLLLDGMAGAGGEIRRASGPPIVPGHVLVSWRLREAYAAIHATLQRLGVASTLESESLGRAVSAMHGTDVDTGRIIEDADEEEAARAQIVGQLVELVRLSNASMNGEVGVLVKWHPNRDRWEVRLLTAKPGESIAVRPTNLEFMSDSPVPTAEGSEGAHAAYMHPLVPLDEATDCPVCLATMQQGEDALRLECGHAFHRSCVQQWFAVRQTCPLCRQPA